MDWRERVTSHGSSQPTNAARFSRGLDGPLTYPGLRTNGFKNLPTLGEGNNLGRLMIDLLMTLLVYLFDGNEAGRRKLQWNTSVLSTSNHPSWINNAVQIRHAPAQLWW